jgi:guanine nucleotide exchange factor VAV
MNAQIIENNLIPNINQKNPDWIECVKWLDNCKVLPHEIQKKLLNNELSLCEFANSLRDGELLCSLANFLIPGSITINQITKRSSMRPVYAAHIHHIMSQMLSLKNIRLFLDACVSSFGMNESDLFDEHMVKNLFQIKLCKIFSTF